MGHSTPTVFIQEFSFRFRGSIFGAKRACGGSLPHLTEAKNYTNWNSQGFLADSAVFFY